MTTLEQAIKDSGGYAAVAAKLGVKRQAVWTWINRTHVPANRVLSFERVTGVPRQVIRPDVFTEE